jgi:phospholipase C
MLTLDQVRDRVQRIFIVMMENRSFDHVLGHLSLPGVQPSAYAGSDVNGLTGRPKDYAKLGALVRNAAYRNLAPDGTIFYPHHAADFFAADLPHERSLVDKQINGGRMDGFVAAYLDYVHTATTRPDPMGFMTAAEVPTSTFLATQYAICDRWHAPIPTDTQPNRLMAISGFTRVDYTAGRAPDQYTVFDWLTDHDVDWRVYSHGLTFYLLMKRLWPTILTPGLKRFRAFDQMRADLREEGSERFPQVVFIEPSYASDPFHATVANDNHPPAVMAAGEAFLASVLRNVMSSPDVFARSLMVVTYDEHGGFFDHVPPPAVTTSMPSDGHWRNPSAFSTLGVRVPAFIISPYAKPAATYQGLCDHTSILQFLGDLYGNGEYSPIVTARRESGSVTIDSLASVLQAVLATDSREVTDPPNVQFASTSTPSVAPEQPRAIDTSFTALAAELQQDQKYGTTAFRTYPQLEQFRT